MADEKPDPFFAMLRDALGDRIDPGARNFLDLMDEGYVMEFPYARPGMASRIEGRDRVIEYLVSVAGGIAVDELGDIEVHETGDPAVVIVEFSARGRALATGEVYDNRYISIIETAGGKIVRYRDYWNPLAGLRARLGRQVVDDFAADDEHGDGR
jgi:ketosteroid isomerase-like protein